MKIIYIAGPYRAPTAWRIAENVRAAERVGLEVARAGAMPLIPHANTAHFQGEGPVNGPHDFGDGIGRLCKHCGAMPGEAPVCHMHSADGFWLDGTLELMRRCDAVLLVPGWESSSGTRAEIEEALALKMQVGRFSFSHSRFGHIVHAVTDTVSQTGAVLPAWLDLVEVRR